MADIAQKYNDTTKDLLYQILVNLGGTMADIEQIYFSNSDDLLYAILKLIKGITITGPSATIKAGTYVSALSFISATTQSVQVGTTPDGNDVFDQEVTAHQTYDVAIHKTFDVDTTLYITHPDPITVLLRK